MSLRGNTSLCCPLRTIALAASADTGVDGLHLDEERPQAPAPRIASSLVDSRQFTFDGGPLWFHHLQSRSIRRDIIIVLFAAGVAAAFCREAGFADTAGIPYDSRPAPALGLHDAPPGFEDRRPCCRRSFVEAEA